jgi:hypothetical protein
MPQASSSPHRTVPTIPTNALVLATNEALADKNFRDSLRAMHAGGYPLVDMVDALGLEDDMTKRVREIVQDLPADVVVAIRAATIAMLDSGDYELPIDCTVTDTQLAQGVPVHVAVVAKHGRQTIHVRPRIGR